MEAIDLTISDSDDEVREVKRPRLSSPDDEVQIVEKPATLAPAAAGPLPDLGDEDFLITREIGPVWNQDLPHCRTQCGKHKFVASKNASNKDHCGKCFCYVCDVEADKCQEWGSGLRSKDHCNAHHGRQLYRDMRAAARQSAASASKGAKPSGGAGPPRSPASPSGRQRPQPASAARPSGSSSAAARRQSTGSVPAARPPAPSSAARPGAASSQGASGGNVSSARDGPRMNAAAPVPPVAMPPVPLPGPAQDDSDGIAAIEAQPELEPGPDPAVAAACELPRAKAAVQRIEPYRILPDPRQDEGMLRLGTIQLPIKAKAPYTVADLQERLVPTGIANKVSVDPSKEFASRLAISNILDSEMLELLPFPPNELGCERTPMRVRRVTIVRHDGSAEPLTIGVSVRKSATFSELLDAVKQHPAAACSPEEELVMGYCEYHNNPLAKVCIQEDLSKRTDEDKAKKGFVAFRVPSVIPDDLKHPSRVLVHNEMPQTDANGGVNHGDAAHMLLLDLPGDLWKGGKDREKSVSGSIVKALQPYRIDSVPSVACRYRFALHRCNPWGSTLHMRPFAEEVQEISEAPECISDGVLHLVAHWKTDGLKLYDTESWSQPKVHDSASQEAMAETEFLIQEQKNADSALEQRRRLPRDLAYELSKGCRSYTTQALKHAQAKKYHLPAPVAACKLAILPAADPSEEQAMFSIQIYIWKKRGAYNRVMFRREDDWARSYSKECLESVMEFLTRDDPLVQAMREEVAACDSSMLSEKLQTVQALMKWLEARERPEAPQPAGLTVQLHPYQRQSLRFMLDNERGDGGHRRHFWIPYKTPRGVTMWWSPIFQRTCSKVAPYPWGGFLAEEMGCGKTVEILALILANPAPPEIVPGTANPDGSIQSRATLVLCPVSLVGQWMEEARSKLNGSLRMYQYHGQGRIKDAKKLATDYDLVVTTYQTLGSDWRMYTKRDGNTDGNFKPLGQIKWHRVVLDESHNIKAGGAQQALACCALKADRRWCCSGTPIATDVSDFIAQFNFLGCPPFSIKSYFQDCVKTSGASIYDQGGYAKLLYALNRTAIRHTQQQRLGGETVCKLPGKTEETVAVNFSEEERRLYLRVHKDAKSQFKKYASYGTRHVVSNLLAIMSLLNPLRAICSGGILREKDLKVHSLDQEDEEVPAGVDPNLVAPQEECSICLNNDLERPCQTPCLHWFCRECITAELAERDKCPVCRKKVQIAQLTEGVSAPRDEDDNGGAGHANAAAANTVVCESKLRVLLAELAKMREGDPTAKALIFTQFNSTLEWLMSRLTQEGYGYRTISGSMPMKKRSQAIEAFQRDPPTTVFLLSMRSGAVGINLTAANHVFILEPAMNPALEDQAVGRAFRMGQTRPVTVRKLYIKGSVEERIIELVKSRREGTALEGAGPDNTIAHLNEGEYEACLHKGKMKQQEVAGSISRDRQKLRLAELHLLFQDPVLPIIACANQAEAAEDAAPAPAEHGGGD